MLFQKTLSNSVESDKLLNVLLSLIRAEHTKTQPAITCSKLKIEILEQGVKFLEN